MINEAYSENIFVIWLIQEILVVPIFSIKSLFFIHYFIERN